MYAVVLDACVLVPTALCDTLLRLAEDGFYRPLWSEQILGEVETLSSSYARTSTRREFAGASIR